MVSINGLKFVARNRAMEDRVDEKEIDIMSSMGPGNGTNECGLRLEKY